MIDQPRKICLPPSHDVAPGQLVWPTSFVSKATVRPRFISGCTRTILLKAWNGPTKCNWPNCSSSRLFKETSDFKSHLNNIHVAPLHCPVAECSRLEPFGKQCDLDRHVKNIHQGLRVFCPIKTCESNSYGFARKHNLVKHMREEHDNIMSGALLITAAPRFLMENKNRISRMLTGTMNAL